jgi:sugar/nucleoside kinase (ribokinase family)
VSGIAVVGSLTRDVVAGGPPRVGGAPYWCARALAQLDRPSVVVARCALADSPLLVPPLEELGVPVTVVPTRATPAFSFDYDGDTRRMTVDAVADPWTERELAAVPDEAEAVHVGALFQGEFPQAALAALARGDRLISLDGQGLVRPRHVGPLRLEPGDSLLQSLEGVTVLKLAVEEAEALLGEVTRAQLARLDVPEVVVTYGARGALVWADGRLEHVAPPRIVEREPTGAGDTFAVGYLAARADGAGPVEAAEAAAALVADVLDPPEPS